MHAMHLYGDIAICFRTPEQSEGGLFRRLRKVPKINSLPGTITTLGNCKTNASLIIPTHMSTNSKNLVISVWYFLSYGM